MKKLLAVLIVFAVPAVAQETYSIPATANQASIVDRARILTNRRSCTSIGLPKTCTQADVDILAPAPAVVVYPDSLAGRTGLLKGILVRNIKAMLDAILAQERIDFCDWFEVTATEGQRNAVCSAAGLPNGCTMCRNR